MAGVGMGRQHPSGLGWGGGAGGVVPMGWGGRLMGRGARLAGSGGTTAGVGVVVVGIMGIMGVLFLVIFDHAKTGEKHFRHIPTDTFGQLSPVHSPPPSEPNPITTVVSCVSRGPVWSFFRDITMIVLGGKSGKMG
jgi:hypothetical protein